MIVAILVKQDGISDISPIPSVSWSCPTIYTRAYSRIIHNVDQLNSLRNNNYLSVKFGVEDLPISCTVQFNSATHTSIPTADFLKKFYDANQCLRISSTDIFDP
jgi:hypothetical protein